MFNHIYKRYFDEHKPLRHYTQHFLVAAIGIIFSHILLDLRVNSFNIVVFLVSTYLIDLDGAISLFLTCRHKQEFKEIIHSLKLHHFYQAATQATTYHKKLNRLIVHNVFGFSAVIIIFINSHLTHNELALLISSAIMTHFIFDVIDDLVQLGHVRNWLWPLQLFRQNP